MSERLIGSVFLSTLSLRRATVKLVSNSNITTISIHALLAESDLVLFCNLNVLLPFLSTLSLRRATRKTSIAGLITSFLSTLSLRRATLAGPSGPAFLYNFYPRSPCGERRWYACSIAHTARFLSTLSLRRATLHCTTYLNCSLFLSTLSLRRATHSLNLPSRPIDISIHALLAESDSSVLPGLAKRLNFYPRSPCGERPTALRTPHHKNTISIHALLAESDLSPRWGYFFFAEFLSTLSLRRATYSGCSARNSLLYFYPRSPCGERRPASHLSKFNTSHFYPRSPCGERPIAGRITSNGTNFYPRSPCGERLDF